MIFCIASVVVFIGVSALYGVLTIAKAIECFNDLMEGDYNGRIKID